MFRVMKWLACALALALAGSGAMMAGEWGPWPTSTDNPLVAAGFKHDDGGALIVMCDPKIKIVSIGIEEPRASWQPGATMNVITKSDDGAALPPSNGVVIAPTRLVIKYQATFDLWTMSNAKNIFAVSVGDYVRTYPTAKFREAVDPILRACGDHF